MMEGVPAHGSGWNDMIFKVPSQHKPFYDSMKGQWCLCSAGGQVSFEILLPLPVPAFCLE